MKFKKIKAIYDKEMLDLLRDKKTLIMMVLVPVLVLPLIMIVMLSLISMVSSNMQTSQYAIAVEMATGITFDMEGFCDFIEETDEDMEYQLNVVKCDDLEAALSAEEIDAYVLVNMQGERHTFEISYLSSSTGSQTAASKVKSKLKLYGEELTYDMLEKEGLDAEFIMNPIEVITADKASKEASIGSYLGMMLPLFLIISILMGALYPAIDITSGEKERGTLETLLTLPVRNDELIMGKFLAVSTIAVVTALLNIVSMGCMGAYMLGVTEATSEESLSIDLVSFIPAIIVVVLCIVVFAFFISALIMCVTTFAKSFKEANNYTTPILLVVMIASYVTMIPNIQFTPMLAAVPVVNICLLISNLMVFKYELSLIVIVLVTNIAYAALAILVLSKIYNSEEIVFGEGGASFQIFTNRKELKKGGVPNISDAVIVGATSLLLLIYVGSLLQVKLLVTGVFLSQLVLVAVPIFATWYTKKSFKETFAIKAPKVTGVVGAVILEAGVYVLMILLAAFFAKVLPQETEAINSNFDFLLEDVGVIMALLVTALTPAICEEMLFRGYLLSAAKNRLKPYTAILIVSALFGLYHMNFAKFFTTGILGIAFCYAVYKSGSIFLGCIMHFMTNAMSVFTMYEPELVGKIFPVLLKDSLSVPDVAVMLVIAVICCVVGVLLIGMRRKKN